MLALTSRAAEAIDDILSDDGELPDEAGIRIVSKPRAAERGGREPTFHLAVVDAPDVGDQVLEEARVFLQPEAAALLEDKLLEADLSGEQVHFAVTEQG